jgi:hypothetical protein
MCHVWRKRKMHTKVWLEKLSEKEHLEDSGVDGSTTLQQMLKQLGRK